MTVLVTATLPLMRSTNYQCHTYSIVDTISITHLNLTTFSVRFSIINLVYWRAIWLTIRSLWTWTRNCCFAFTTVHNTLHYITLQCIISALVSIKYVVTHWSSEDMLLTCYRSCSNKTHFSTNRVVSTVGTTHCVGILRRDHVYNYAIFLLAVQLSLILTGKVLNI